MAKSTGLTDKTDAELVSLIGQANAILSDRRRARNDEFSRAMAAATRCPRCGCPDVSECTMQPWKPQCGQGVRTKALLGSLYAGRAALAERGGADGP